jgi:hypothetical protein
MGKLAMLGEDVGNNGLSMLGLLLACGVANSYP